jgi:hypothetical protein
MTAEEIAGHVLVGILFFVGLYLFSYPVARLDPTVGEDWCILLSFALMAAIWSREMEPIPAWLLGPMGWLVAFARAWSEISESGSQRAWHDLNTDAARDDVLVNTDAARVDVLVRAPESGSQRAWHDFNTPYEERTARERAEREARRAWEAELRERMYENWADGNFSNPFRIPGTGPIDN